MGGGITETKSGDLFWQNYISGAVRGVIQRQDFHDDKYVYRKGNMTGNRPENCNKSAQYDIKKPAD